MKESPRLPLSKHHLDLSHSDQMSMKSRICIRSVPDIKGPWVLLLMYKSNRDAKIHQKSQEHHRVPGDNECYTAAIMIYGNNISVSRTKVAHVLLRFTCQCHHMIENTITPPAHSPEERSSKGTYNKEPSNEEPNKESSHEGEESPSLEELPPDETLPHGIWVSTTTLHSNPVFLYPTCTYCTSTS